jgi:hypothetical protein
MAGGKLIAGEPGNPKMLYIEASDAPKPATESCTVVLVLSDATWVSAREALVTER